MILRLASLIFALIAFNAIPASANQAGVLFGFVSATGNDQPGCGTASTTPCYSIQAVLPELATGATIVCLSPVQNAGTFTISSSVTIICPATVLFGAITISLPSSDTMQTVHLEGLTLNPSNTFNPLSITAAGTVVLQGMRFRQSASVAVKDTRTSPGKLLIKDTIIDKSPGPGVVIAGSATNTAVLDNVTLINNAYGIAVASGNRVIISRSTISGNSTAGVEADGGSFVVVNGSTISNNSVGVQSGSAVRLSNNDLTFNTTAVSGATGTFGNNRFSGNGSDGTALTPVGAGSTDLAQK